MRLAVLTLALPVLILAAANADPAKAKQAAAYKAAVLKEIDGMAVRTQIMVDTVFSFGELGFQEIETSKYLTGILEKEGFHVEHSIAGIPTGWMASWGSGKPVIALGSDIDCIPQASQKPGVAWHEPIIEGAPGHGEGHNSGVPLNITAAIAVKHLMEREHLPGTIKLWPGVAEEALGAKAQFVRAGVFKDADVVLFAHVGNNLGVSWGEGGQTGLISVEYQFKGESAHAAGAPWRGRSALDAVELMDVGWNFRREHLRLQQRSHYVITNGGDQPNVVPPNASVWYYFREMDYEHIKDLWKIGDDMAQGASLDDQHHVDFARARLGLARPHEQDDRRNDVRQHQGGRPAAVERSRPDARESGAARAQGSGQGLGRQDRRAARTCGGRQRARPGRRRHGRRIGRYRRRVLECPDRHVALSRQHSESARDTTGLTRSPWRPPSRTKERRRAPKCKP